MSDLLPPNASPMERRVDETLGDRFDMVPGLGKSGIRVVWNPDDVPLDILPFLAHAFSVDLWDDNWSEEAKRNVTEESLAVHRRKGTQGAIKDALRAAGYGEVDVIDGLGGQICDGSIQANGVYFASDYDHWAWFTVIARHPVSIAQAHQMKRIIGLTKREACRLHQLRYDQALNLCDATIIADGAFTAGVVDGQLA